MSVGFLDTIGLVAGVLGIISFGKSNFPGGDAPSGTEISIKAGIAANLTEAGGGINEVYCYDADNQYLGSGGGGGIVEGGVFTSTCDQSAPDTQGDFVDVTFTNDAVCVAWITVTMHDGSPSGAWTGDIGANCGETWYTQTQTAGNFKDSGTAYVPRCAWFDGDHTTGGSASLKFRTRAYGDNAQDTVNNNHQCSSTLFGTDNTPVDGEPARKKRDTSIRPTWMSEQLIVSNMTAHAGMADELCNSATSWGPDFIDSTNGQHCNMESKTLAPLCSTSNVPGCVSLDDTTLTKRTIVGKRDVHLRSTSYAVVKNW